MMEEAADAIKAVNAQYGYAPEFLSIGRQVGAVIASVDRITQSSVLSTIEKQDENFTRNPLTEYTMLDIEGTKVEFKSGLVSEMKDVVRHVIQLQDEVERLSQENEQLRMQDKKYAKKHSRSEGWER
ncbi:MAG: hypothetical protein IJ688_14685 [Treponema sp.]|nr:hypothetical protein [Treponema sp.]